MVLAGGVNWVERVKFTVSKGATDAGSLVPVNTPELISTFNCVLFWVSIPQLKTETWKSIVATWVVGIL